MSKRSANNQRSNSKNPNNRAYHGSRANQSNQGNPNNQAHRAGQNNRSNQVNPNHGPTKG